MPHDKSLAQVLIILNLKEILIPPIQGFFKNLFPLAEKGRKL